MYIICEKLEGDIHAPILNDYGYVSHFNKRVDAIIERILLQPKYVNKLVIIGEEDGM